MGAGCVLRQQWHQYACRQIVLQQKTRLHGDAYACQSGLPQYLPIIAFQMPLLRPSLVMVGKQPIELLIPSGVYQQTVRVQIGWRAGAAMLCQIIGSGADHHVVIHDFFGNQTVIVFQRADAQHAITAFGHQIHHMVAQLQFDLNVGIALHELRHQRRQQF